MTIFNVSFFFGFMHLLLYVLAYIAYINIRCVSRYDAFSFCKIMLFKYHFITVVKTFEQLEKFLVSYRYAVHACGKIRPKEPKLERLAGAGTPENSPVPTSSTNLKTNHFQTGNTETIFVN